MIRSLGAGALLAAGLAAGCSPTFNWREVRAGPTPLTAMLPCKPETATRRVPMAGRDVELTALSCEAGGATFALLFADIGEPARLGEVLAQWNTATLANLRSDGGRATPFRPPGALELRQSLQVVASGRRPDGSKVECQAAYFAQGSRVYQAVIYAGQLRPEAVDGFLAGLRFQ
jgi:hypothetical protein